jgi:glycosyltransferase involved in cell wall biosynthesis
MFEGRHVRVVVPAYNEEKLIERVVTTMPAIVDQIIVVDDCSKDKTPEVLACLQT